MKWPRNPSGSKPKIVDRLLVGTAVVLLLVTLFFYFNGRRLQPNTWRRAPAPIPSKDFDATKDSRCFLPYERGKRFVFFLETSTSKALTIRQSCAVESAALWNPKSTIALLKLRLDGQTEEFDAGNLKHSTNIEVHGFDVKDLVTNTPIEQWFSSGRWESSQFKVVHISDAMRYVVLYQCGGIYMDLDVVVLRTLERLKNSLFAEHSQTIGNALMVFERGHEVPRRGLNEWGRSYDPAHFATNGPQLLSDIVRSYCGLKDFADVSGKTCKDLDILPPAAAFPYPWEQWEKYFEVHDEIKNITSHFSSAYLLHLWNRMSSAKKVPIGTDTLYERIMRENCPSSYAEAKRVGYI